MGGLDRHIFWQLRRKVIEEYLEKIWDNTGKIKTSRAKAVYLLLCASAIPLRFIHIQEILNISKATVFRALEELLELNLISKSIFREGWEPT